MVALTHTRPKDIIDLRHAVALFGWANRLGHNQLIHNQLIHNQLMHNRLMHNQLIHNRGEPLRSGQSAKE